MKEKWKDIKGYEGRYKISSHGRVTNATGKFMATPISPKGYAKVFFSTKNKTYGFLVSRLVAIHFCPGYKHELTVNHKDGVKLNNHYKNLEWVTNAENMRHAARIGLRENCRGERSVTSKLTSVQVLDIRRLKIAGIKNKEIINKYGISKCHITRIVSGESWRHI